ncbi:MAG TPA: cytochrome c peroxidase [Fimbriiglobus sp.]|nr:cytochrome c peroxidase [Fimbriiglobus sp.]
MPTRLRPLFTSWLLGFACMPAAANPPEPPPVKDPLNAAIPNDALKLPFRDDGPIHFVTRNQNAAEWDKLPTYWNETTEEATDPTTGAKVTRKAVKIKVPLGLSTAPVVPAENPMTVAKWELGKKLYFDKTLSTSIGVSCATCHDPAKGFTDQRATSLGINDKVGGVNAPTVINSAYHRLQFWDGRAATLEEQAQGPVGNPVEMFAGQGDAWEEAVARLRARTEYVEAFRKVFGHLPTRDAAAKAIASYERTVLVGNSLHDRADAAMRKRVAEEESGDYTLKAADYEAALTDTLGRKDTPALSALGVNWEKGEAKPATVAARLVNGRNLFFGKAKCSNCHVGDNFTDNQFHNLGVGVKDGKLPEAEFGRYVHLPTGHKDVSQVGAFKTPGLRALLATGPYMHDGKETSLEAVIDFYDRGGNANEFLDSKMRDTAAEDAYLKAKAEGKEAALPKPAAAGEQGRLVVPLKLSLSVQEKADLILFLKALQSDPVDPVVADPQKSPDAGRTAGG